MAHAQQQRAEPITFDLIGVNEGLPHAWVDCLLEDLDGRLWVGMQQGLAVYDGSAFVPVNLENGGSPILTRNLALDEEGIIWVAAEQGPVRVDPVTHRAELLTYPDSLKQGVETLWSHAVAVTAPGEVLFGTHKGTFFLDVKSRTFRGLRHADGAHVRTYWEEFFVDTLRKGIWIGTHDRGLVFYDLIAKRLIEKADASPSPLLGTMAVTLCPDGNGGFWCGDRSTGQLTWWDGRTDRVRTWNRMPGNLTVELKHPWSLKRDRQGRIWGSAFKPGGFMLDPRDSSSVVFQGNRTEAGGLPHGRILDLYQSINGEIWLANSLGIAIYDPAQPQARFIDIRPERSDRATSQALAMEFFGDSLLWCALGRDGLLRIDPRSGERKWIPLGDGPDGPRYVWEVLRHGDELIVACSDALFKVDTKSSQVRELKMHDGSGKPLPKGQRWLASGSGGSIWMGTAVTHLSQIDADNGLARVHVRDSTKAGLLRVDGGYDAVTMPDGRTWVCGNTRGLSHFDPTTDQWTDHYEDVEAHRLRVSRVVDMAAASDSLLWLASDGAGLVRYNVRTGEYSHFNQHHGITELGLLSVAVDPRGRIWTHSDERVFCFDVVTERAIVVNPRSSTGGVASKWTLAMSPAGMLAMNVGQEVAVFNAPAVGSDRTPPPPVFTRLLIDGAAQHLGAKGDMHARYDHAQIEVHFGAILPPGSITAYAMRAPGEVWSEQKEGHVTLRGLQPGQHRFEFRLMSREGAWGPAATLQVHIAPPWWQTLLARILFGILLAVAIVLVFRARLNWIRKRERALEEQARQMNELKLQALRAQMDPHFIFNCLNSVDRFILGEEKKKASHYLNRFARLIRLILQQSESTTVPLEREVEMLKYYLELESIRFETPFAWEVRVDPMLLQEPIELPTMLVQPFVENAIWHGLQHKQGQGRVDVSFRLVESGMECTIEDNGIGRAASAEINKDRSGVHKSMGMRVTTDRIQLLKEQHKGAAEVTLNDLHDGSGKATGTRAVIVIPLEND